MQYMQYQALLCGYSPPQAAPEVNPVAALCLTPTHLRLTFTLFGALNALRLPPAKAARRAHGLWMASCFEMFLAPRQCGGAYLEINVTPDHRWNIYLFRHYRSGMRQASLNAPPIIHTSRNGHSLRLTFTLALAQTPTLARLLRRRDLALNLCAILADCRGELHYYTLDNTQAPADFHDQKRFALVGTSP